MDIGHTKWHFQPMYLQLNTHFNTNNTTPYYLDFLLINAKIYMASTDSLFYQQYITKLFAKLIGNIELFSFSHILLFCVHTPSHAFPSYHIYA